MRTDVRPTLPFHRDMTFEYGVLEELEPGIRRLVCHNPGAFTFKGTNTYVLGVGEVAVVDPGPSKGDNVDVLLRELRGEKVREIVLTHCHGDHSGAVAELQRLTHAPTYGMPRRKDDPIMLRKASNSGGDFVIAVNFDHPLSHGERFKAGGFDLEAIHTPGHAPDHLCYHVVGPNVLLSGDHVMGWNTSIVAPPEGHMGSYIRSLEELLVREEIRYYPGHGAQIADPRRLVKAFILHRRWREADIAEYIRQGYVTIDQLVPKIYAGIESSLIGAASFAVYAQIELMVEKGLVRPVKPGPLSIGQEFELTEQLS